jgi:hypothetical protein
LPLVFLSPTSPFASRFSLSPFTNLLFYSPLFFVRRFSLDLVTMSDFGMAETDNGQMPKIGCSSNLDAKTFVLGQGNVMGKENLQEFFECVGKLNLDDTPILKRTKNYAEAISALVLKFETRFIRTHPTLQRLFFELPVLKEYKAKSLATRILMNEFDYIIREAREIFDFYGVNHEKLVINEILYNSEYMLRHLLGDNQIFDENLKKEVPVLNLIQQVFNDVNNHYSWIVVGNQKGYLNGQLDNAKIPMENVFQVIFAKTPNKDAPSDDKRKDDNT